MDTERLNREARQFQKERSCFIHVECDNGQHEAIVAGDGGAIIDSLASIVGSIAEGSNTSPVSVLSTILYRNMIMKKEQEEGAIDKRTEMYSFPKIKKPGEE